MNTRTKDERAEECAVICEMIARQHLRSAEVFRERGTTLAIAGAQEDELMASVATRCAEMIRERYGR